MLLTMGELICSIHTAESISTDCHQRVTDSAMYVQLTLYLVICVCLVKVYTVHSEEKGCVCAQ